MEDWNQTGFKVLSNPVHSVILWQQTSQELIATQLRSVSTALATTSDYSTTESKPARGASGDAHLPSIPQQGSQATTYRDNAKEKEALLSPAPAAPSSITPFPPFPAPLPSNRDAQGAGLPERWRQRRNSVARETRGSLGVGGHLVCPHREGRAEPSRAERKGEGLGDLSELGSFEH